MGIAKQVGQAGLQGWRGKVADRVADPVAARTPLDRDLARSLVGLVFFVLSVTYVVKTVRAATRAAST